MHILNTRKVVTDAARAEIKRLKRRQAVLMERRRVLEELIAEQEAKAKQPDKPDSQ